MSGAEPYWTDGQVTLYVGDCRTVLPALGVTADCIVADPPYGETSLPWDKWPAGWLNFAAACTSSLWCFGSLRMFLDRSRDGEFAGWKLSQDVIWEKQNGTGFADDRFKRVHESVTHWYRGDWGGIYHQVPKTEVAWRTAANSGRAAPTHTGSIGNRNWEDDGTRIARTVQRVPNMWRRGAIHPTEKPVGILAPLITYACPPGGLVVDPFAGSGSTLDAARQCGRRAIGVEAREDYAERAARRLSQAVLDFSEGDPAA